MKPVFTVIPAVDLRGGRCVRLRQGQASEVTVYSDAPEDMARHWAAQGAAALHIVDLDGAFAGRPEHTAVIRAMIAAVQHIPVQVGGGLRTDADIQAVLDAGAARAIIGTRALGSAEELRRLAEKFGANLALMPGMGWYRLRVGRKPLPRLLLSSLRALPPPAFKRLFIPTPLRMGCCKGLIMRP